MQIAAPRAASAREIARPMPRDPPVTITICSAQPVICSPILDARDQCGVGGEHAHGGSAFAMSDLVDRRAVDTRDVHRPHIGVRIKTGTVVLPLAVSICQQPLVNL